MKKGIIKSGGIYGKHTKKHETGDQVNEYDFAQGAFDNFVKLGHIEVVEETPVVEMKVDETQGEEKTQGEKKTKTQGEKKTKK